MNPPDGSPRMATSACSQSGSSRSMRPKPCCARLDFLAVVEHQRDVACRLADGGGQMQEHRVTGFHVRCAAAVQFVIDRGGWADCRARGTVSELWPLRVARATPGPGSCGPAPGVAVADDFEAVGLFAQRGLRSRRRCAARDATRWECPPAPRSARSGRPAGPGPWVSTVVQ